MNQRNVPGGRSGSLFSGGFIMRRIFAIALVLVSLCSVTAVAQTSTTSLRGVVTDSSGALVPQASVTLSDQATGTSYHAVSNASGYYIFPVIAPAHYLISVSFTGFAAQT